MTPTDRRCTLVLVRAVFKRCAQWVCTLNSIIQLFLGLRRSFCDLTGSTFPSNMMCNRKQTIDWQVHQSFSVCLSIGFVLDCWFIHWASVHTCQCFIKRQQIPFAHQRKVRGHLEILGKRSKESCLCLKQGFSANGTGTTTRGFRRLHQSPSWLTRKWKIIRRLLWYERRNLPSAPEKIQCKRCWIIWGFIQVRKLLGKENLLFRGHSSSKRPTLRTETKNTDLRWSQRHSQRSNLLFAARHPGFVFITRPKSPAD